MAARKRKPNESFKAYRRNLKVEERHLKQRLKGRLIWDCRNGSARAV